MNNTNKQPRGLRNNNPLNIRITPKQRSGQGRWQGMRQEQKDGAFCQFEDMKWGWRAAFMLLTRNYYAVHHLHTIRQIISRWAPPQDNNNTEAYVERVARLMHYHPDRTLGIPSVEAARWMQLGLAMAIVENGTNDLDYFAMLDGWMLCREEAIKGKTSD